MTEGESVMYENFVLREPAAGKRITGYRWDVEDPDYVVCLVHGIGEYAGRYQRVAEAFNDNKITLVGMDHRGHGLSMGSIGHCAPRKDVLEDVDFLIDYAMERYPGKPVILYGHSMGGNIAMDYRKRGSRNHLISGFVISAPWVELVRPVSGLLYMTVKTLAKIMPKMTISSGGSEKPSEKPDIPGYRDAKPFIHHRISIGCAVDGFTIGEMLAEGRLEDNGGAKGTPMLLMHGTADKTCNVKGSRKVAAIEECEYVEWPGLFHELHSGGEESTGEEVISKMVQWIRGV